MAGLRARTGPFLDTHIPKVLVKNGADIGSPSTLHMPQVGESQMAAVTVSAAQERLSCTAPFLFFEHEPVGEEPDQGACVQFALHSFSHHATHSALSSALDLIAQSSTNSS